MNQGNHHWDYQACMALGASQGRDLYWCAL